MMRSERSHIMITEYRLELQMLDAKPDMEAFIFFSQVFFCLKCFSQLVPHSSVTQLVS